jgi:hypothetical protein
MPTLSQAFLPTAWDECESAIGVSVQGGTKEYLVRCINKHPMEKR